MPLVDLDDPVELRARWAALAAVAHATGRDRIWWADDQGLHYEDSRGNDLRLILIADGRAVMFGYHYEESRTADEGVYADLLAGAPDWIGQPEVRHRVATGQLGFVYGHFAGTWARAEYPGDPWQPLEDGFLALGSWLTDDREAEYEVAEQVLSWVGGDYLAPDEVRFGAMGLIRAAGTTGLGPQELGQFFAMLRGAPVRADGGPPDLRAGAMAAAMFGGPSAARAEQAAQVEQDQPPQPPPFAGPAPVAQSPCPEESAFVGESPFVGASPFAPESAEAGPVAEFDEADAVEEDDTTGFFQLFEDDGDDEYEEYEEYEDEQVAYDQPRYE